jgi:predicted  nucleic acid-binding Zn-ribbon protein
LGSHNLFKLFVVKMSQAASRLLEFVSETMGGTSNASKSKREVLDKLTMYRDDEYDNTPQNFAKILIALWNVKPNDKLTLVHYVEKYDQFLLDIILLAMLYLTEEKRSLLMRFYYENMMYNDNLPQDFKSFAQLLYVFDAMLNNAVDGDMSMSIPDLATYADKKMSHTDWYEKTRLAVNKSTVQESVLMHVYDNVPSLGKSSAVIAEKDDDGVDMVKEFRLWEFAYLEKQFEIERPKKDNTEKIFHLLCRLMKCIWWADVSKKLDSVVVRDVLRLLLPQHFHRFALKKNLVRNGYPMWTMHDMIQEIHKKGEKTEIKTVASTSKVIDWIHKDCSINQAERNNNDPFEKLRDHVLHDDDDVEGVEQYPYLSHLRYEENESIMNDLNHWEEADTRLNLIKWFRNMFMMTKMKEITTLISDSEEGEIRSFQRFWEIVGITPVGKPGSYDTIDEALGNVNIVEELRKKKGYESVANLVAVTKNQQPDVTFTVYDAKNVVFAITPSNVVGLRGATVVDQSTSNAGKVVDDQRLARKRQAENIVPDAAPGSTNKKGNIVVPDNVAHQVKLAKGNIVGQTASDITNKKGKPKDKRKDRNVLEIVNKINGTRKRQLEQIIEELKTELAAKQDQIDEFHNRKRPGGCEDEKAELNKEIARLKTDLKAQITVLTLNKKEIRDLKRLATPLEYLERDNDEIASLKKNMDHQQEVIKRFDDGIKEYEKKAQQDKDSLEEAKKKLARLKKGSKTEAKVDDGDVKTLEREAKLSKLHKQEVGLLTAQIGDLLQKKNEIEAKFQAQAKKDGADVDGMKEVYDNATKELTDQLKAFEEEKKKLIENSVILDQRMKLRGDTISKIVTVNTKLAGEVDELEKKNTNYVEKNKKLQEELDASNKLLENAKEQIDKLKAQITRLNDNAVDNAKRTELENQLKLLEAELQTVKTENSTLNDEINKWDAAYKGLDSENAKAVLEITALEAKVAELTQKCVEDESELAKAKEVLSEEKAKLAKLQVETSTKDLHIQDLKDKINGQLAKILDLNEETKNKTAEEKKQFKVQQTVTVLEAFHHQYTHLRPGEEYNIIDIYDSNFFLYVIWQGQKEGVGGFDLNLVKEILKLAVDPKNFDNSEHLFVQNILLYLLGFRKATHGATQLWQELSKDVDKLFGLPVYEAANIPVAIQLNEPVPVTIQDIAEEQFGTFETSGIKQPFEYLYALLCEHVHKKNVNVKGLNRLDRFLLLENVLDGVFIPPEYVVRIMQDIDFKSTSDSVWKKLFVTGRGVDYSRLEWKVLALLQNNPSAYEALMEITTDPDEQKKLLGRSIFSGFVGWSNTVSSTVVM